MYKPGALAMNRLDDLLRLFSRMPRKAVLILLTAIPTIFPLAQEADTIVLNTLIKRINERTYYNTYPDSLLYLATKGLEMATSSDYVYGTAEFNRFLGRYYYIKGEYSSSLEKWKVAKVHFDQLGKEVESANIIAGLGMIYRKLGDNEKALKYNFEAAALLERLNPVSAEMASVLNSLGLILRDYGDYNESIRTFNRCIGLYKMLGDSINVAGTIGNLAIVYRLSNRPDSAIYYQLAAQKTFERLGIARGIVVSSNNLAAIHLENKNYREAYEISSRAEKVSRENGYGQSRIQALVNSGRAKIGLKEYNQAIHNLSIALDLAEKSQSLQVQVDINRYYAECYQQMHKPDSALSYYKKFTALKDSLFRQENATLLSNLRISNEVENKDAMIQLLEGEKVLAHTRGRLSNLLAAFLTTLAIFGLLGLWSLARRQQLRATQKEKDLEQDFNMKLAKSEITALRAQMNPHFIFNCLNSINRYIIKADIESASSYLTRFSRLIRLILENSSDQKVSLQREMETIELYLQMESVRFSNKFSYSITIDPEIDTAKFQIPPMILQPYIENSIWHGLMHKDGHGELRITVSADANNFICTVEDNGIGRHASRELEKDESKTKSSIGMRVTEDRLRLLTQASDIKAETTVIDLAAPDGTPLGTRVLVTIPLSIMLKAKVDPPRKQLQEA